MATQVQRRKGTTVQHSTFTGASAELTVDTTKNTVVVHNGATAGGFPLAKETEVVNLTANQTVAGVKTLSSNPALTSGSVNGVAYLNGSKVLTTGSALTFDGSTLTNTGALNIQGNTTLGNASTDTVTVNGYMGVGGAGSSARGVSVISSALTSTGQTGVYSAPTFSSSATTLGIALWANPSTAAASFAMQESYGLYVSNLTLGSGSSVNSQYGIRINDQTNGTNNYGITSLVSSGTNKWNIYASGTAENYFNGGVSVGLEKLSQYALSGSKLGVYQAAGNAFQAGVGASGTPTAISVVNNGNQATDRGVAIDLYSPGPGLGGNGTHATARLISASSASSTHGGYLRFDTENTSGTLTERLRIDSSGNLGLGVTPRAWGGAIKALQIGSYGVINQTSNVFNIGSNYYSNGTSALYLNSTLATLYQQASGEHRFFTAPSGTAGNAITFTQAMTLDASGNLLVGQTTQGGSGKVCIGFSGATNWGIQLNTTSASNGDQFATFRSAGTTIGSITQATSTTVSYNTSSDYRLKDITGPITTSGAYIDSLNPVEGTWKADGSTFVGLIAHEVQEASRTQVATGVKDGEEMQGMDYSSAEIIANLIAEVKSLRARLAAANI